MHAILRAACALIVTSGVALSAETPNKPSTEDTTTPPAAAEKAVDSMEGTELAQADCTKLWLELNASSAPGLTQEQTKGHVKDFKKANPDGDATIDQKEWMSACKNGMVSTTSAAPK